MGTGAGVVSTYEGVLRISAEQKGKYWSCLDNILAHKWGVRQMSKHVYAQSLGGGTKRDINYLPNWPNQSILRYITIFDEMRKEANTFLNYARARSRHTSPSLASCRHRPSSRIVLTGVPSSGPNLASQIARQRLKQFSASFSFPVSRS